MSRRGLALFAAVVVFLSAASFPIAAAGAGLLPSRFTDPEDGQLDLSEWLIEHKGFLPVPIIITEPAVGAGAGLGLLFVRNSMRESAGEGGRLARPDIFGMAVAATENGTKVMGAFGMFGFDEDRWRYRGILGKTHVNLDFYGFGSRTPESGKLGYTLDGFMSSQQLLRRVGASENFVGVRWIYFDLESTFERDQPRPRLPDPSFAQKSSGLGVTWERDSRDNIFTPSRGALASIETMFYDPAIGSDNTYQTYRARVFAYAPIGKSLVLAGRVDGRAARGDVPFYQKPFIDMRGIPAVRYQGDNTAIAETEVRWNMARRWAMVGFVGAGRAWGARDSFGDAGNAVSKGAGVRYLLARRLGMYVGLDYARGPEENTVYITVGNAWR